MKVNFKITYVSIYKAPVTDLKIGDVLTGEFNELRNRITYQNEVVGNLTFSPGENCEIIETK